MKGLKGCDKMSKGELIELLDATSPNGFNLANLSKKELWVIAEVRGVEGYKKMSRSKLIETFSPDLADDDDDDDADADTDCLEKLSEKTLRVLVKSQDTENYKTMSKPEPIEAIYNNGVNARKIPLKEYREFVKAVCGIEGTETMNKPELSAAFTSVNIEKVSEKVMREIAREGEIEGWNKMSKGELFDAISSNSEILENLSLNGVRAIASMKAIEGYKTMNRFELIMAILPRPKANVYTMEHLERESRALRPLFDQMSRNLQM